MSHLDTRVATRRRLEAIVERALALLDAMDGDPDYEPEGLDEPPWESLPERAWRPTYRLNRRNA